MSHDGEGSADGSRMNSTSWESSPDTSTRSQENFNRAKRRVGLDYTTLSKGLGAPR